MLLSILQADINIILPLTIENQCRALKCVPELHLQSDSLPMMTRACTSHELIASSSLDICTKHLHQVPRDGQKLIEATVCLFFNWIAGYSSLAACKWQPSLLSSGSDYLYSVSLRAQSLRTFWSTTGRQRLWTCCLDSLEAKGPLFVLQENNRLPPKSTRKTNCPDMIPDNSHHLPQNT